MRSAAYFDMSPTAPERMHLKSVHGASGQQLPEEMLVGRGAAWMFSTPAQPAQRTAAPPARAANSTI